MLPSFLIPALLAKLKEPTALTELSSWLPQIKTAGRQLESRNTLFHRGPLVRDDRSHVYRRRCGTFRPTKSYGYDKAWFDEAAASGPLVWRYHRKPYHACQVDKGPYLQLTYHELKFGIH